VVKFTGRLTPTPSRGGGTLVPVPAGVARELGLAAAAWDALSYTDRKEIARSLDEAKKPETRERRLAAALERLRA